MSGIKSDSKQQIRAMLNTTINKEVLDGFKSHCKAAGLPMNTVLETFMMQFTSGEFVLMVGKNKKLDVKD